MKGYLTARRATALFLAAGVAVVAYRLLFGLGAVTALTDQQPWGLIKAVNILGGAALAAGSFSVAALAGVFGINSLKPAVRPALLLGFLLHTTVLAALLYDVGRPIYIWRILINPNFTSVMTLTFVCELIYTMAVAAEVTPILSAGSGNLVGFMRAVKGPVLLVSATVAVIYQGALGSLYLVSPHRVSPLWYTAWLPPLFFLSAVPAGLAVVIMEAYFSDRAGRRPFDLAVMGRIGGIMAVFLAVYLAVRAADLSARGGLSLVGGSRGFAWFIAEIAAGFALPLMLLLSKAVRGKASGLLAASSLVVLGVIMDRLGIVVIGWANPSGYKYFPAFMEFYASFFFLMAPVVIYSYLSGKRVVGQFGFDRSIIL